MCRMEEEQHIFGHIHTNMNRLVETIVYQKFQNHVNYGFEPKLCVSIDIIFALVYGTEYCISAVILAYCHNFTLPRMICITYQCLYDVMPAYSTIISI